MKNHPPSSPYAILRTEKRRYAVGGTAPPPHCFSVIGALWTEEAPLSRGRGCPPTALLLTGVFVGDMFLDMSGNFQGSRGEPWLV